MLRVSLAKRALVANAILQPVEFDPDFGLDKRPPQIDRALGDRGRRLARQPFAHHQAEHVGQAAPGSAPSRRPGRAPCSASRGSAARLLRRRSWQARRSPRRAPVRPPRRSRLHRRPCRLHLAVDAVFVIGEPQRVAIARAAHRRHFVGRQRARGQGKPRLLAAQHWRLGGEGDLELRLARERTHRARHGALERIRGILRSSPSLSLRCRCHA